MEDNQQQEGIVLKCRLASFNQKTGRIRYDPALRRKGNKKLFKRVKVHMKTFKHERLVKKSSFTVAQRKANKRERGNMTMKQWRCYNGKLGALARWHSTENR